MKCSKMSWQTGAVTLVFKKTQWTNTSRWHCTPNHHRLWKLNTGLQATWAMSFSTLPPDSRTLVSKRNTKLALIWKEDFGPLGNSPVLLLLSRGVTVRASCIERFTGSSKWKWSFLFPWSGDFGVSRVRGCHYAVVWNALGKGSDLLLYLQLGCSRDNAAQCMWHQMNSVDKRDLH